MHKTSHTLWSRHRRAIAMGLFIGLGWLASLSTRPLHAEELVIAAEDDWAPYSSGKDHTPQGFSVDVVSEAFKAVGVSLKFNVMPFARLLEKVKSGEEIAGFNCTFGDEMNKIYAYHKVPLIDAKIMIFAKNDYDGKEVTINDLKNIPDIVGVTNGYTYSDEFDYSKEIKKDVARTDELMLRKLAQGKTKFGVIYDRVALHIIGTSEYKAEMQGKLKPVGTLTSLKQYVIFSRANPKAEHFLALFEKGLETIMANGTYEAIIKRWDAKLAS
jgi:polar amino acid transport system substrate-binding protein